MAFDIIKKNGKEYRRNINKNGNCKYHKDLKCVCCNPECDHNCSIDDELQEKIEDELMM